MELQHGIPLKHQLQTEAAPKEVWCSLQISHCFAVGGRRTQVPKEAMMGFLQLGHTCTPANICWGTAAVCAHQCRCGSEVLSHISHIGCLLVGHGGDGGAAAPPQLCTTAMLRCGGVPNGHPFLWALNGHSLPWSSNGRPFPWVPNGHAIPCTPNSRPFLWVPNGHLFPMAMLFAKQWCRNG